MHLFPQVRSNLVDTSVDEQESCAGFAEVKHAKHCALSFDAPPVPPVRTFAHVVPEASSV